METPLSQSNVSLKLTEIQKRCEELMQDGLNDLRLEDSDASDATGRHSYNPYDRND